jgi:transcriptional regulator with XRE-family HTH domain
MAKDPKKEFKKKFGEKLKEIRLRKKLSQRDLSSLCTIDNSDISRIESGAVDVQITTVRELAEALEVKAKELLDFE